MLTSLPGDVSLNQTRSLLSTSPLLRLLAWFVALGLPPSKSYAA